LQAVEEQAGTFGVQTAAGQALQDEADGGLDGTAVVGQREVEGGQRVRLEVGERRAGARAAGGVVVVAEGLVAEAFGAAAVAVGEDVAALEVERFGLGWHGVPPPG
jgi:hypothetical protein